MTTKAPEKKKTTELMLNIDGEMGAGKTALFDLVLLPAIAAMGGSVAQRATGKTTRTETILVNLPEGALRKLADAPNTQRVGLGNIDRVFALVTARRDLIVYAEQDMAATVARMALPKSLKDHMDPAATIAAIKADARAAIRKIDAELETLGFDLAAPPA